jgi:sugar lactone lactonase YvrE
MGTDPAASVREYLYYGYKGDTWTGVGINSSTAASDPGVYAVGYDDGNVDKGGTATSGNVVIAFTLAGDANLDRHVNFADLLVVAQNFNHTLDTRGNPIDWADGDFNYDGNVNFTDLLLVSQNFNKDFDSFDPVGVAIDDVANVFYVDPTATGSNDTGTSWANAFPDVQSALSAAQTIEDTASGTFITIDVAQGTYSPGASSTATFQMINDVSLYGGYPGYASGNPDLDDCNVSDYPTVLYTSSTTTDAVTATGTNTSAVLSGFTIADAGAPVPTDGIEVAGGSPTIADCIYTAPQYIWVADGNYEAIQEFASSGSLLVQSGTWGTGDGDFLSPEGVATDANGNVWVTDVYNNRVEEFSPSGVFMMTFGSYGSGDGQFAGPSGIAIDAAGHIWVADTGNDRVEEFSSSGSFISEFGSYGSGNGQFQYDANLAIDHNGNIWVVDCGGNRVEEFSPSGSYESQFGGYGSGNGQLFAPRGIAVDANNDLWVTDTNNNRIEEFSSSGAYMMQVGTAGSGDGQFDLALGIAIDANGDIWVADNANYRLEEFSSSGVYMGQIDSIDTGDNPWGGPYGLAID